MKKIIKILLIITLFIWIWFWIGANAINVEVSTDLSPIIEGCSTWDDWSHSCEIENWTTAIMQLLWWIIKYATFIVWLLAVLFIVVNGIMYSMWGMDQSMKEESKKRIVKTIVWLIVLLMSWTILNIVAPWIYK
jgi:hypothetical protein